MDPPSFEGNSQDNSFNGVNNNESTSNIFGEPVDLNNWKQDTDPLSLNLSPDTEGKEKLKKVIETREKLSDSPSLNFSSRNGSLEEPPVLAARPSRIKIPSIKELEEVELKKMQEARTSQENVRKTAREESNHIRKIEKKRCKTGTGFYPGQGERNGILKDTSTDLNKKKTNEENFRKMINEKYKNYVERKKSENCKAVANTKQKKPLAIKPKKSSSQPRTKATYYNPKTKANIELLLQVVAEHAKECPKFRKKLQLAGIA